jgi:hypothetical protein
MIRQTVPGDQTTGEYYAEKEFLSFSSLLAAKPSAKILSH